MKNPLYINFLFFIGNLKYYAIILCVPLLSFGQSIKVSAYGFNTDDNKKSVYKAIRNNDTIIIDKQDSEWLVSPLKFRNLENKTIIFEKDVIFRAKPNAYVTTSDCLLKFISCKNINIIGNGALLTMNKEEYVDGEWRMGLSFMGCSNVVVADFTIANSGGDGIYIDGYKALRYSENIRINNVVSTNNKRQGISIISAKDVWVKNSVFTKTKGTLPEAGLDIEPDKDTDVVINVNFEHCSFTNNYHSGIVLGLDNLTDKSEPVSINFIDCYLSMNHDISNRYPKAEIIVSSRPNNPVKGKVTFNNIVVDGSKWGLIYSRKPSDAYHTSFKNLSAINICQQKDNMSVIYLEVPNYFKSSGPIGGFSFENTYVKFDSKSTFFTIRGSSLGTLNGVKDITGHIILEAPNLTEFKRYIKYNPNKNINFDINYTLKN
ncbi:right-handed parallel beta-helix repeat-containing protein [Winogradskyella luteola]|uniref:Right-handed parallel beta-helix repeat-containing protein n=1 Tax=Winogradskyella luteola TaxID=2828330 RepID=A0A9X1F691_9FLAO|nr:right-handed parallel beta-helix repeat-containing protein [Winogradskyella luteola]MBV7268141.1 right-handed parallel beta-helix repeat-containing protein [Winogradskyella luteola]